MRHLYATRAAVFRLDGQMNNGSPTLSWQKVRTPVDPRTGRPGELQCRLDLAFMRVGRDQPMPIVAGRAPDRIGVMFYAAGCDVRAGDRIKTITGPIDGTFEIRAVPDPAQGFSVLHHMEVQVIEVSKNLTDVFPGGDVEEWRVEA